MVQTPLFDTALLKERLKRQKSWGEQHFLWKYVCEGFTQRLADIQLFAQAREGETQQLEWHHTAELALLPPAFLPSLAHLDVYIDVLEDFPEKLAPFDLILSGLALQIVEDIPGLLRKIRMNLREGGLFCACLIGGESLSELRTAFLQAESESTRGVSPRVVPFIDLKTFGMLLQNAGFKRVVTESELVTLTYATPASFLNEIKEIGATNMLFERSRKPIRHAVFRRALDIYQDMFSGHDHRVRASLELIWVTAWA